MLFRSNEYKAGPISEGADGPLGSGGGKDGGYPGGTGKGKVRFVRLHHSDRGWSKNFGPGADRNLLMEYGIRGRLPKNKVAEETEVIEYDQIARLKPMESPPLLYIAGFSQLSLSQADKKILREYLTEKHGMILGDNLGGQSFHGQFIAMMNELTGVTPVPVPRDDLIHRTPSLVPEVPIVVAHGGTVPLGWKLDGRWVVYYHPGALSDAWRDDHAGIRKEIYEMCYQLGVNIVAYAYREKSKWIISQKP